MVQSFAVSKVSIHHTKNLDKAKWVSHWTPEIYKTINKLQFPNKQYEKDGKIGYIICHKTSADYIYIVIGIREDN